MPSLIEIDLGKDGIGYVRDCLGQGTGLCRRSLRLPLKSGQAAAIVPTGTSIDRAKSFVAGGLLRWCDSIEWLAEHTRSLWQTKPEGTLIFQDVWGAKPNDTVAKSWTTNTFSDEENLYHFTESVEQNVEKLERRTGSFLLIAFFVGMSLRDQNLQKEPGLANALMEDIAASTMEILVTAYDREGFVLWRRLRDQR